MTATSLYFAHTDQYRRASIWTWESGGDLGAWNSDGKGNVTFKGADNSVGGTEHWRTRHDWLICTGFSPPPEPGGDWPIEPAYSGRIIKAVLTDLNSGVAFELPPLDGAVHYYAPTILWRDPLEVANWVMIDGTVRMFWACRMWPSRRFTNPITHEIIPDGIVEQEVWWDATDGWVRGSGTPPFDAQGNPLPVTWQSTFEVGLAPGIGVVYGRDLPNGPQWGTRAHWTF
jgi:hypothetical protein